jgi:lipoprotein-anchoring transpeptidase ErfK/SrfK
MSKFRTTAALAALIAGAALAFAPARAQQLPTLFLRPPVQTQPAPQIDEPQTDEPQVIAPEAAASPDEGNENAQLAPRMQKQVVDYPSREAPGTVIVDTPHTFLYYVLGNGKAIRYGIGVGRDGFTWSGVKSIIRKTEWPDWYPPADMVKRQPYLPRMIAGGPGNPLGARAMYISGTEYRIHGTNDPSSIGKQMSSGCIRMTNDNAIDLYNRVTVGTKVVVLPMTGAPVNKAQAQGAQVPAWQAKAQAAIAASKSARTSWNSPRPARLN